MVELFGKKLGFKVYDKPTELQDELIQSRSDLQATHLFNTMYTQ